MGRLTEFRVEVLQLFLAAVATVAALFLITDDQIAGVLGLSQAEFDDASLILSRLRLIFRIALLLLLVLCILGAFALPRLWRRQSDELESEAGRTGIEIVSIEDGLHRTIDRISRDDRAQTLKLWGYSLGWTARLSQYLEGNPQPALAVAIFVPDPDQLYDRIVDPKSAERAAVLRLRLDEWNALQAGRRIGGLEVFALQSIPNDLGLLLDDRFALLHSYTWKAGPSGLTHVRQDSSGRHFIQIADDHDVGMEILGQLGVRMLCRSYDSQKMSSSE